MSEANFDSVSLAEETPIADEKQSGSTRSRFPTQEMGLFGLFALPPLILLLLFAWGITTEVRDGDRVQQFIASHSSDWPQLRSGALTKVFDERTSKENTAIWQAIFTAVDRFEDDADNIVEGFSTLTPPGKPWPAEPYAVRKVQESQWIDRYRGQLKRIDKPMWAPALIESNFNWWPQFQDARKLLELDSTSFRLAYHEDDHDRALAALSDMNQTIAATDWWWMPSSNYQWVAHQQMVLPLIRDSVQFSFWSDKELDQLRRTLTRAWQIEKRFEQSVQFTLASRLQTAKRIGLDDRQEWHARDIRTLMPFGISDTHLWDLIDSQQRVLQVSGAGTWEHVLSVRKIESGLISGDAHGTAISLVAIPFARSKNALVAIHRGAFQLARQLAQVETERRWTLTAIAVRQYRNQFEQWPERLSQLSRVGLTASEWEFEPGKPFGYHVSKDETQFRLWTPDIDDYLSNPNVRELSVDNRYLPTQRNGSRKIMEERIVRIRDE